jgi:hypothetical protein
VSQYGNYKPTVELSTRGFTTTYLAERVAGNGPAMAVLKVLQLCGGPVEPDDPQGLTLEFLNAARAQQRVSKESPRWGKVYQTGLIPGGAYCVVEQFPRSLQRLLDMQARLSSEQLFSILGQAIEALADLRRVSERPHGNLKASNVLLRGRRLGAPRTLALADPLPAAQLAPGHAADDVESLGRILWQIVTRSPSAGHLIWPVDESSEWAELGGDGQRLLGLCNLLLDPEKSPEAKLDLVQRHLAGRRRRRAAWRTAAGMAAMALLAVLAFGYIRKHPPAWFASIDPWNRSIVTPATTTPSSHPTHISTTAPITTTSNDTHTIASGRTPTTQQALASTRAVERTTTIVATTKPVNPITQAVAATTSPSNTITSTASSALASMISGLASVRNATRQMAALTFNRTTPTTMRSTTTIVASTQTTATTRSTSAIAPVATTSPSTTQPIEISRTATTGPATKETRGTVVATTTPVTATTQTAIAINDQHKTNVAVVPSPVPEVVERQSFSQFVGVEAKFQLVATQRPLEYQVTGGLPAGMVLDAAAGTIHGTAWRSGDHKLQARARNVHGWGPYQSINLSFGINPADRDRAGELLGYACKSLDSYRDLDRKLAAARESLAENKQADDAAGVEISRKLIEVFERKQNEELDKLTKITAKLGQLPEEARESGQSTFIAQRREKADDARWVAANATRLADPTSVKATVAKYASNAATQTAKHD